MDHRQPPPHPQPRNDFFFQDGPHHGHDGGWWPLHVLFLLLFIALIIVAAVWLLRRLFPGVAQATAVAPAAAVAAPGADPAVATLRMRYAKGEVSREDFRHALADLTEAEAPTGDPPAAVAEDEAPTT
jgi:uncharacterized membrane protein